MKYNHLNMEDQPEIPVVPSIIEVFRHPLAPAIIEVVRHTPFETSETSAPTLPLHPAKLEQSKAKNSVVPEMPVVPVPLRLPLPSDKKEWHAYYLSDSNDVTVLAGSIPQAATWYPAHKEALSDVSGLLKKFFERHPNNTLLSLPCLSAETFEQILSFAYNRKLLGNPTILQCEVLLSTADKYIMTDLSTACLTYMFEKSVTLTFDNFWSYYSVMVKYDKELIPPELLQDITYFLTENAEYLLNQSKFLHLDYQVLTRLIQSRYLRVSELLIFNRLVNWAKVICAKKKAITNSENIREAIKELLKHVRLLTLTDEELPLLAASCIVKFDEMAQILSLYRHSDQKGYPDWFSCLRVPRTTHSVNYTVTNMMQEVSDLWAPLLFVFGEDALLEDLTVYLKAIGKSDPPAISIRLHTLAGVVKKSWTLEANSSVDRFLKCTLNGPVYVKKFTPYLVSYDGSQGQIHTLLCNSFTWKNDNERKTAFVCGYAELVDSNSLLSSAPYWEKAFAGDNLEVALPESWVSSITEMRMRFI